jgi:hypothetical protein
VSNQLLNALGDAVGGIGYLADTPGAYLRGALGGKPGERLSGEDMLKNWGVHAGPLGGFAAEAVLDPTALLGLGGSAFKAGKFALNHTDDLSHLAGTAATAAKRFAADESGALRPFQKIGHRADPDFLNKQEWFHGTATPGLTARTIDPMKTNPNGLFGRGIYKTLDPFTAGEYAEARTKDAAKDWADRSIGNVSPLLRKDRDMARSVSSGLVDALGGHTHFWSDIGRLEKELAFDMKQGSSTRSSLPGIVTGDVFHRASYVPDSIPAINSVLAKHGIPVMSAPEHAIYKAKSNVGNVLDLDQPPDAHLLEALRGMTEKLVPKYRESYPGSLTTPIDWIEDAMRGENVLSSDVLEAAKPSAYMDVRNSDPLIQALREAGYDAMTHQGGVRAGGGKNLHQVLITLDPNDTLSRVGRGPHITQFDQLDPEAVRSLLGWK